MSPNISEEIRISASADSELFLVIDQGGHASRVVVFDRDGAQLVSAERPVGVQQPQENWVEQDADEIVQSVRDALAEVVEQLGTGRHRLRAAGMATQRSNIVCWDSETGQALSPAISWQDRRAQQWMQPFEKQRAQIHNITGLLPSAHYGVSKIHWCLENLPEAQAAHKRDALACGPLASFLLFRLLKENPFVVDAVNASRTLLWDWRQRCWSATLLNMFDVSDTYLPQGDANRYPFGQLEIADVSIPLSVCTGDQSAALFANGKPEMGTAYINMGTGAFMQCVMPQEKETEDNRTLTNLLRSVVWDDGKQSIQILEATVNGAGSALLAVADELGLSVQDAQGQYDQWLTNVKDIPLYLNGISGLGSPFWLPLFDSQFVGPHASEAHPPAKMVAVLESIVFLLCVNLDEMSHAGVKLQSITVSGGLSVLDGLCQRLADLSQLPVERSLQTEATTTGLVFLLVELKQSLVQKKKTFVPQKNQTLSERYQHWNRELLTAVDKAKNNIE